MISKSQKCHFKCNRESIIFRGTGFIWTPNNMLAPPMHRKAYIRMKYKYELVELQLEVKPGGVHLSWSVDFVFVLENQINIYVQNRLTTQ